MEHPSEFDKLPEVIKKYLTAQKEGRLKDYYVEWAREKKDNYSDELPDVDVRTLIDLSDGKPGTRYKCQGNYIIGLSATIQQLKADIPNLPEKINLALKKWEEHEWDTTRFTTKHEITLINDTLNEIIEGLS